LVNSQYSSLSVEFFLHIKLNIEASKSSIFVGAFSEGTTRFFLNFSCI